MQTRGPRKTSTYTGSADTQSQSTETENVDTHDPTHHLYQAATSGRDRRIRPSRRGTCRRPTVPSPLRVTRAASSASRCVVRCVALLRAACCVCAVCCALRAVRCVVRVCVLYTVCAVPCVRFLMGAQTSKDLIYSGGADSTIRTWDPRNGNVRLVMCVVCVCM